jgi:flavin-dependent dehydrogenase
VSEVWDIAVVGAGPAGCASAITLRQVAPGLRVMLLAGEDSSAHRVGETLPAPARSLLEQLGVWSHFLRDGHVVASGTASSWGGGALGENDSIYSLSGHGWHLDRRRFDETLLKRAEASGVVVSRDTKVTSVVAGTGSCRLEIAGPVPREIEARFVIDATGRSALISRGLGSKMLRHDQLTGIYRVYEGTDQEQARTLVEPCAHGWWYSAGLPGRRHLIALMTDGDLAAGHHYHRAAEWEAALAEVPRLQSIAAASTPVTQPRAKSAASGMLDICTARNFLAVGDAASTFDPLSSLGILKGLRSGIFGAYAAADWLVKQDETGLERYQGIIQAGFKTFLKQWRHYYQQEQRWPDEPFWRRRHTTGVPMRANDPEVEGILA